MAPPKPVNGWKAASVTLAPLTFGFIGWFTGYMLGASSTPVVGAIIPAVLGAFLAALLSDGSKSRTDRERVLIAACVLLFGVLCFAGIRSGADDRRETLSQGYDPPTLEVVEKPDSVKPGAACDPRKIQAQRKPIIDLISRWKLYLVSRRLNLTKDEYEGLTKLWREDERLKAAQWPEFAIWLKGFADSGQLRDKDADVLGGPRSR